MMQDVVAHVRSIIKRGDTRPVTSLSVGSTQIPYDTAHFSSLSPTNPCRTLFVDGGNAEVFSSPHLAVHFIRIYGAVYSGATRLSRHTTEGFAIIRLVHGATGFSYQTHLIGMSLAIPEISLTDMRLGSVSQNVMPQAVADVVRHCLEWQMIDQHACEAVVKDGALHDCPQDVYRTVSQNTVLQIGVSKTTTALTNTGVSAPYHLSGTCPPGSWVYAAHPTIGFAKLHPRATHVFRIDVKNGTLHQAASLLVPTCTDATFLGYPYGLLEADLRAAVTAREQRYLRHLFVAKYGTVQPLEQASDAHDMLNALH